MSRDKLPDDYYGVDETVAKRYIKGLEAHIAYVQEAGRLIGVHEDQLAIHDDSKWSVAEFPAYARYFSGDREQSSLKADDISDQFAYAWLHHIQHNPHHWQSWIFPDGYTPKGSTAELGVLQMPNVYALEMIADWMGASMAYSGSWDMSGWLAKHIPHIRVHSKTADYLIEKLDELGYADIVNTVRFGSKVNG